MPRFRWQKEINKNILEALYLHCLKYINIIENTYRKNQIYFALPQCRNNLMKVTFLQFALFLFKQKGPRKIQPMA